MSDPYISSTAPRSSYAQLRGLVAALFTGALNLPLVSETTEQKPGTVPDLKSEGISRPRVFIYKPSQRDPFVDASVKLTLLSQKSTATPPPEELGLEPFTQELHSELLLCHRITGVVSGEREGVVLIGRRILRTGDTLALPLGADLFAKMQALNETQHLGLEDILASGLLNLEIVWITASGIGLSHGLLVEPLTLPYLKKTPTTSHADSTPAPK